MFAPSRASAIGAKLRLLAALLLLLPVSCITEDVPADDPQGNFDALWKTLDENYCFFSYKAEEYGLDWLEVRARYAPAISSSMTRKQLFEVLAAMTYELRDGHVNLTAAHDMARYGRWFDDYPMNYSDSLERVYLGRSEDYAQAGGLQYRVLDDNIGYVRCSSFSSGFGDGNLQEVMRELSLCSGLIVDVRNNSGGLLTMAEKLATLFINETTVMGYMCHKNGTGHDDFSSPRAIKADPFQGLRWQKNVAVLSNRRTYSAANSFVMYVKGLPRVTVVGDRTGGGAGLPFSSELPSGWALRFSACPMYNRDMELTEMGIDPDVKVDITSEDYARNRDTIIETARQLLRASANPSASGTEKAAASEEAAASVQ